MNPSLDRSTAQGMTTGLPGTTQRPLSPRFLTPVHRPQFHIGQKLCKHTRAGADVGVSACHRAPADAPPEPSVRFPLLSLSSPLQTANSQYRPSRQAASNVPRSFFSFTSRISLLSAKQNCPNINLRRLVSGLGGECANDLLPWLIRQFLQKIDTDPSDFFITFQIVLTGCEGYPSLRNSLQTLGVASVIYLTPSVTNPALGYLTSWRWNGLGSILTMAVSRGESTGERVYWSGVKQS